MKRCAVVYSIVMSGLIYGANLSGAAAQSNAAPIKSAQSSGVTVAIARVAVSQRKVTLQLIATNETKARVYLRDAWGEQSQRAFLGSGEQLSFPSVIGIERCDAPVTQCSGPDGNDLNRYSYIEPGEFTAFGFTYESSSPVNENDTISLTAVLVARFTTPNGDPSQVGPLKAIRFNFPFVPLNHG